jgi:hypothetical protein
VNTHATKEEPFLSSGSVNTTGILLETVFSVRFVQSCYKEEFLWKEQIEFQSERLLESRVLHGKAEKMAL